MWVGVRCVCIVRCVLLADHSCAKFDIMCLRLFAVRCLVLVVLLFVVAVCCALVLIVMW